MSIKSKLGNKKATTALSLKTISSMADLSQVVGGNTNFGRHEFCRFDGGVFQKTVGGVEAERKDGDCQP